MTTKSAHNMQIFSINGFITLVILTLLSCNPITTNTLSKTLTTEYPKDSAQIVYNNFRGVLDNTDFSKICLEVYEQFPNAKRGYLEKMHIDCNKVDNVEINSDTSKFKLVLKFTMDYENGKDKEGQDLLDYYIAKIFPSVINIPGYRIK